jgi:lipopolysaccharide transport protein LptA
MLKQFILKTLSIALLLSLHCYATPELTVTADNFFIDYKKNYGVYTDNVQVSQQNKNLVADHVYIYFNNKEVKEIIAKNKKSSHAQVKYLEKKTQNNKTIIAEADTIIFHPITNRITLKGNAKINQDNKTLTSALIYYDVSKDIAYLPKTLNNKQTLIIG